MKPIIQCITNNVTMNDCANAVLLSGASPIMAHHPDEVVEVQKSASALLLNLGATDDYDAMVKALDTAKQNNHLVVLDPVGVAGISFRRDFAKKLLKTGGITCIRGNYKEIKAIITDETTGFGLDYDSRLSDADKNKCIDPKELIQLMNEYADKTGIMLVASGTEDIVCNGSTTFRIKGGDEMMSSITGSGCMLSAIIASRITFNNSIEEVAGVLKMYGMAGENAAQKTRDAKGGIGTFHMHFLDELSLTEW